jgi:hypothetical protein
LARLSPFGSASGRLVELAAGSSKTSPAATEYIDLSFSKDRLPTLPASRCFRGYLNVVPIPDLHATYTTGSPPFLAPSVAVFAVTKLRLRLLGKIFTVSGLILASISEPSRVAMLKTSGEQEAFDNFSLLSTIDLPRFPYY